MCTGQGRHTFLDGSYYEGSWVAGERSTGVFLSADGQMEYRGQWRGLLRHGQGTLFQKGLLKYTGAQPCQAVILTLITSGSIWLYGRLQARKAGSKKPELVCLHEAP